MSTILDRFVEAYCPEPNTGCWLWIPALTRKGYGRMRISDRMHYAHRVSWEIFHGPIPENLSVCHKCDTPACVNPEHLFLGTQLDNIQDMCRKHRQARGEVHGYSKLTNAEVMCIRSMYASGEFNSRKLARIFDIRQDTIFNIVNRKTWKHLP